MFDKFIRFMYMVLIGVSLLAFITIVGYRTHQDIKMENSKLAIETQRVLCDCITQQMYLESKKGGI